MQVSYDGIPSPAQQCILLHSKSQADTCCRAAFCGYRTDIWVK